MIDSMDTIKRNLWSTDLGGRKLSPSASAERHLLGYWLRYSTIKHTFATCLKEKGEWQMRNS